MSPNRALGRELDSFLCLLLSKTAIIEINTKVNLTGNQGLVYNTILNNPRLRKPMISDICGLSKNSVDNAIRVLKKRKLVDFEGTSKIGGFFVTSTN